MSLLLYIVINMPTEQEKKKKLLEKFPKLTPEQIEAQKKKEREVKGEADATALEYENNLVGYFERTEEIKDERGKVLALVRYPSYDELLEMVPPELAKYRGKPLSEVPLELEEKYSQIHFDIMATLIVKPKKKAEWWRKQKGVMRFVVLFNKKLAEIVKTVSEEAENFRIPAKV